MSKFGYVFLCLGIILLALAGCSQDENSSPTALKINFASSLTKSVGPSDIVFCLDVSDTVSADELQDMVSSLGASLSNGDLVPQDGTIAVGAFVYGDTIASVFEGLVAVTADNLANTIIPALNGLTTDRLVTGTGADLAGAWTQAAALLEGAAVNDLHILTIGSGEAIDTVAVSTACDAITAAGIMNSALLLGTDEANSELIEGCVDASAGYFQIVTEDLEGACTMALQYMLLVEMTVEPAEAELNRGEDHTVTALIFRGGDADAYPLSGQTVTFTVIEGPNAGEPVNVGTDTLGMAAFTYTGSGGAGTDVIAVGAIHPGTGTALADTVMATWLNTPPECEAGGPYTATFAVDTTTVTLDASGSSDADGDTLTFNWSVDFEGGVFDDATAMQPVLTVTGEALCADSLMVYLTVSDGIDSSTCEAVIILDDQRAPVIEIRDDPIALWPPNHKYHTITPEMVFELAEDACGRPIDLASVEIVSVSSDEPEDDKGDGKTVDDIVIDCPNNVMLRAERMGGGMGRVYTIVYRITGDNEVETEVEFQVIVPHDQSGKTAVARQGMGYTVTPDCPAED